MRCGQTEGDVRLERCSVCHRRFCFRCAVRRAGKGFCSLACAELFFFGEEDESE